MNYIKNFHFRLFCMSIILFAYMHKQDRNRGYKFIFAKNDKNIPKKSTNSSLYPPKNLRNCFVISCTIFGL